jgi:hypothetical protein
MRRSVLIVDDHAGFRSAARELLEAAGFEVVGDAADGAYPEGNGPFPERLHVTVVGARLVLDRAQTEINWATWAISEVEQWSDTETSHDPDHLLDLLEAAIAPRRPGTAETHSDTEYAGES